MLCHREQQTEYTNSLRRPRDIGRQSLRSWTMKMIPPPENPRVSHTCLINTTEVYSCHSCLFFAEMLRQSGSLVEDLVSDAPEPVISDSPSDFYLCLPVFLVSFFPGFVFIVISLSVFLYIPPTSCGFLHAGERHQARIKLCFLRCVGLVLSEIL